MAKNQENDALIDEANPVDAANPKEAPVAPIPDLLYSNKDLQAILDKYEEERRKALEEEIKKASKTLPAMLPKQSVADYVNINRDSIKAYTPQIFEKIGGVNKAEHEEMQKSGGYKPISFNKGAPSSLEILGKDNKPIYTLNYRSDGDLVIAEVPPSISKGPMHLSLALQDANGENIEADKAAYFNISYGADGKIKSMNYPEPLEFEGDRCKFLIDKQPYYLKVDKATLDVLNAEIAKNRGQGVKRAQDIGFEQVVDDQEQQPQPPAHAPAAQEEVVILPEAVPQPIARELGIPQNVVPIGHMVAQAPAKPAQQAIIHPAIGGNHELDEHRHAMVYSNMPQSAGHVGHLATQTPAPAVRRGALLPSVNRDNHDTELDKAQKAMAEAVEKRVKDGNYNLPQNPINVLRHEVPKAQELRNTPVVSEAPDPEMPQDDLHKAAREVAEAVAKLMPTASEKPVAKTNPTPRAQKDDKAKPVVIGNAVKAKHDAAKPFGDPEHNKHSSPPPGVPLRPLNMDKTPAKKHAVVQQAAGLGGKKAQPFGDPKHNEFAVPPGGFKNEIPQWQKDRAKNNAVAQSLRNLSPVVESAQSPISPSPPVVGAPLPRNKDSKGFP